jgi:hypothetical protein
LEIYLSTKSKDLRARRRALPAAATPLTVSGGLQPATFTAGLAIFGLPFARGALYQAGGIVVCLAGRRSCF